MVQLKVAEVAMAALEKFPADRHIIALCFEAMVCAMRGPKSRRVRAYLTQKGLLAKTTQCIELYRNDPYIVNAVIGLRQHISIIPALPEIVHEEAKAKEESSDEESAEEEEEAKDDVVNMTAILKGITA